MSCCLCYFPPPISTNTKFIFNSQSTPWINGLAHTYEYKEFPKLLEIIDKQTLKIILTRINDDLYTHWPCITCYSFGYLFALCTFGLSFLCPYICISEAKYVLDKNLSYLNERYLTDKGLYLSYTKICCGSYLMIEKVDAKEEVNNKENVNVNHNNTDNKKICVDNPYVNNQIQGSDENNVAVGLIHNQIV